MRKLLIILSFFISGVCLAQAVQENLFESTTDFSTAQTYWTRNSLINSYDVVPNPFSASTINADKLGEGTATSSHRLQSTQVYIQQGSQYTVSIYARATVPVERQWIQLYCNNGNNTSSSILFGGQFKSWFNVSTGAMGFRLKNTSTEATSLINTYSTTVNAPDGTVWYRFEMVLPTALTSGLVTFFYEIRQTDGSTDPSTTASYAGTSGSGFYVYGMQVNKGNRAATYYDPIPRKLKLIQ